MHNFVTVNAVGVIAIRCIDYSLWIALMRIFSIPQVMSRHTLFKCLICCVSFRVSTTSKCCFFPAHKHTHTPKQPQSFHFIELIDVKDVWSVCYRVLHVTRQIITFFLPSSCNMMRWRHRHRCGCQQHRSRPFGICGKAIKFSNNIEKPERKIIEFSSCLILWTHFTPIPKTILTL